jgi:acyl-CoA synthetase (AMP-forming)/AMP-acid ligase II
MADFGHLAPSDVYSPEAIATFYERGYWQGATLSDVLDRRTEREPDRALIISEGEVLTNAEVREQAYRIAAGLRRLGVLSGDRVAVQLPSWPEYIAAYFGLSRLGAVLVPLMPIYRHKEVGYILEVTEASAYIGATADTRFDHLAMVRELRPGLPALRHVITVRTPGGPAVGELRLEDLAAGSGLPTDGELGPRPHVDAGHIIGFTSGTESDPKGCYHTWNSYSFTPRMQVGLYGYGPDDIELVVSPPTHTAGLAAGVLKPLVGGGAMCLMSDWSPASALELITRHHITMATGATPFIAMLADAYDPAVHDASTFRLFFCGGAPVPASLITRARVALPNTTVLPVYGQTESLIVTTCRPDDGDERAASSSGRAVEGVEVAVLGPDSAQLGPGEVGEIAYRTPGAMLGYWRNPLATANVIQADGWRHSGDLGTLDDQGYLQITGRIKDMIIRGGMNISTREIEEMLERHPDVRMAAVVGVPDEKLGERVGAFIVPAAGEPTLAELTDFLESEFRLAKQKLPEVLRIVSELPMTPTGKVSKRHLRAEFVVTP